MGTLDAKTFFLEWQKKTGSDQIANERFLGEIAAFSNGIGVVDYGAGIGTISAWAANLSGKSKILAIEPDEWCRKQFLINTSDLVSIKLVESLKDQDLNIMVGWTWVVDMAFEPDDAERIILAKPRIIMVEGHRYKQRVELLKNLISSGRGFRYRSFGGDYLSSKGGCVIEPASRITITSLAQLCFVAIVSIFFESKHAVVRAFNAIGFGKGASRLKAFGKGPRK